MTIMISKSFLQLSFKKLVSLVVFSLGFLCGVWGSNVSSPEQRSCWDKGASVVSCEQLGQQNYSHHLLPRTSHVCLQVLRSHSPIIFIIISSECKTHSSALTVSTLQALHTLAVKPTASYLISYRAMTDFYSI